VACGANHTVAAMDDGVVAAWGASDFGQCGLDTDAMQASLGAVLSRLSLRTWRSGVARRRMCQMCWLDCWTRSL
jgi:alpha-tubulin suppressor-like RCC1 family protein